MNNTDAVISAPNSHRVIFENENVRVVEVIIPPGKKEPMHTHKWSSVMIVDSAPAIRYYNEGGKGKEYPARDVSKEKPFTEWLGHEGLHAVENLDQEKVYHAIRVELKKQ